MRLPLGRNLRVCRGRRIHPGAEMGASARLSLGRGDVRGGGGGWASRDAQVSDVAGMPVGRGHGRHGHGEKPPARSTVGDREWVSHQRSWSLMDREQVRVVKRHVKQSRSHVCVVKYS